MEESERKRRTFCADPKQIGIRAIDDNDKLFMLHLIEDTILGTLIPKNRF